MPSLPVAPTAARRSPIARVRMLLAVALALSALAAPAYAESPDLVISQVYGGGGNSGATLRNDFIEVFNRGSEAVDTSGWSVQYASSTGTTWQTTSLGGTVAPGRYLLVREAAGTGGTADLPAPDASGSIAMAAGSGKVRIVTSTAVVRDLVGYGSGATTFEGTGPTPTLSATAAALRKAGGCTDSDDNAADFAVAGPTPRNSASAPGDCDAPPPPPPPAVAIRDIQGAGHSSPLAGQAVTTTGIATVKRSNGFYLQDPVADASGATSEAIFVFTGSAPAVAVGDELRLTAVVEEFRPSAASAVANLATTELTSPAITTLSSANALPAAVIIGSGGRTAPGEIIDDDALSIFDAATDGIDFYESLEGMRVQVDDAVVTGPTRDFGSNREIPVLADAGAGAGLRTSRGGIIVRPDDFNPERIILNDLVAGGPRLPEADVADSFPGATVGVIDYSFGNFKLEVQSLPARADGGLERETTAAPGVGELTFATYNVENLDPDDPAEKFASLAQVIVENLRAPDLISVEEVQDDNGPVSDGTVAAGATWSRVIDAVATAGGPAYHYRQIDPVDGRDGGEPGGNIRAGFMFRTDRGLAFVDRPGADSTTPVAVLPGADGPRLSHSPGRIEPADGAFTNSRKPLVGEFTYDGRRLFAVANHWNSKGGDQPLFGRFQPPARSSEVQRNRQAQLVHDFAEDLVSEDPSARVLVLGDLNDFDFSTALDTLMGTPRILDDLVAQLPPSERYSYVFEGNSQVLDHIVTSSAATAALRSFDPVHVNSEFADQTSDHDPMVARICADVTAPSLTVSASPSVLRMPNHKYVTVRASVSAADSVDPAPGVSLVSAVSSEPDDAHGDGSTGDDIQIVDDRTFRVRAERSGTGPGRVYTLTYRAVDACGNAVQRAATVTVPLR